MTLTTPIWRCSISMAMLNRYQRQLEEEEEEEEIQYVH